MDAATGERVSIGTYPTKADADRALASVVHAQQTGTWVASHLSAVSLKDYASTRLGARLTTRGEPLRPRVVETYEGLLRLHVFPTLGDRPLGKLSTPMIRAWHQALRVDASPKTAAKSYRLLRASLNTAVEDRLLVHNPCSIKGAGIEAADERPIPTIPQVYELADAIEPRFRAAVLLAAFGGLRRGELLALRRRDVNVLHRTVSVELQRQQGAHGEDLVGPPKTAAGRRTFVLPSEVVKEIELHLVRFGGPAPTGSSSPAPRAASSVPTSCRSTGPQHASPLVSSTCTSTTSATLAASTGAGTKELMHRLGHVSPQAALRYQHATAARDKAIADGIDGMVKAAMADDHDQPTPFRVTSGQRRTPDATPDS